MFIDASSLEIMCMALTSACGERGSLTAAFDASQWELKQFEAMKKSSPVSKTKSRCGL